MQTNIKTLLFGAPSECAEVGKVLRDMEMISGSGYEYHHVNDMEEFEQAMVSWMPSLIIVLADGAAGMESVYRSRQRRPMLPVFWFSNDREFGMQSYRLECAYFSTKPVTAEKIANAMHRCQRMGISYFAS